MTTSTPDVDDPEAFNHRFAEVNGIRLHDVDEGEGPPLRARHLTR